MLQWNRGFAYVVQTLAHILRDASHKILQPRKKELQNRGWIGLSISHNQIDGWRLALKRTAGYRPGNEVFSIGRNECNAACRRDERHRHGKIVHIVAWLEVNAILIQIIVDDHTEHGSRSRHIQKCLADDILRGNRFELGETVITGKKYLERFLDQKTEFKVRVALLPAKNRGVNSVSSRAPGSSTAQTTGSRTTVPGNSAAVTTDIAFPTTASAATLDRDTPSASAGSLSWLLVDIRASNMAATGSAWLTHIRATGQPTGMTRMMST